MNKLRKTKTQEKHFQYFKRCCEKYLKDFCLDEWHVRYEHKDLGHCDAQCLSSIAEHDVTIALSTEIGYGSFKENHTLLEELNRLAKHEVIS